MNDKLISAGEFLRSKGFQGSVGIILGSGLGRTCDQFNIEGLIPYGDIPGFPESSVPGHEGKLLKIKFEKKNILVMKGRVHYYEGHSMQEITYPVRVLHAMGVETLIVSNAAGGINPEYCTGDFVLIEDHINFMGENPLRGLPDSSGRRFVNLAEVYSVELREIAKKVKPEHMNLWSGVLVAFQGPSYETPAEVRMARNFGGNVLSMSMVPEVIMASYLNIKVLGISCITNLVSGNAHKGVDHEDVVKVSSQASRIFGEFLEKFLRELLIL
jgi:purine-nucleoside phosphorylase